MSGQLASAHTAAIGRETASPAWILVGATGVTGRLILHAALSRGHHPMLAGRASARLDDLARETGLEAVALSLEDPASLNGVLSGHRVVLNAAGPFGLTGAPIIAAAISAGVDYLDINGELQSLLYLFSRAPAAIRRGVALVGGAGFGVAASDGLAIELDRRLGGAEWMRISVAADSAFRSAAVAESTLAVIGGGGWEVEVGELRRARLARHRWVERMADGSTRSFASAPLAELAAVRQAIAAPTILAGVPMPRVQAAVLSGVAPFLPGLLKFDAVRQAMTRVGGHNAGEARSVAHRSSVTITARRGEERLVGRLAAGEGFETAAQIALAALERMLARRPPPGTYTPATAFGPDFIATAPGVTLSFDKD